jgi:anti-sigma28 factor (negative regulator of flagellin synthesis)
MTITGLGHINPVDNHTNTKGTRGAPPSDAARDVINVSEEALKKAEAYYLAEIARDTPDVRADLVERMKQKINDPSYLTAEIIDATASKIMDAFGL